MPTKKPTAVRKTPAKKPAPKTPAKDAAILVKAAPAKKTPGKKKPRKKPTGPPPRHSEATVLRAIAGSGGIITHVAKALKLSWTGARNAIDRYPACKEALDSEREAICDVAENRLIEAINQGDAWAIRFFLNNKAKQRGYGWKNLSISTSEPPKVIGLYAEDYDTPED
jgi:hypothetical protein